jgi:hypothetical protein
MTRKVVGYEGLWQQSWGVDEMGQKERSRFRLIVSSVRRAQWCLQPEDPQCLRNHVRLDHSK